MEPPCLESLQQRAGYGRRISQGQTYSENDDARDSQARFECIEHLQDGQAVLVGDPHPHAGEYRRF
jgi:hypothetical protein